MAINKLLWQGKWIWSADGASLGLNTYVQFRKTFDVKNIPNEVIADISADSKYMLYVNGRFVCRGIPLCDPLYQYYDQIDIAPYLKPGKNAIAVLVHYYGVGTSKYQHSGRPGLLFEAQVGKKIIASDAGWKVHVDEAYTRNVPRICASNMLHGFQEHFDARKDVLGWQNEDFNDSKWAKAIVLEWLGNDNPPFEPWMSLLPRDIPHYFEEERPAENIYRIGEIVDAPLGEDNDLSAKIFAEPMGKLDSSFIENPDAMISWDNDYAVITQDAKNPSACPSVVIDFGKEVTGMLKIDVEGPEGSIVDIGLAELTTKDGINQHWGHLIGMGVAHRYVLRDGRQTFEIFGRFGFKFAQLTFRNLSAPLKLHRVSVNFGSYDVGERGKFECNDALLNEIWKTGAYTIQCCMYDAWEDCPGREQRQWLGDARVEGMINYACFGDLALTRKILIQTGQSQRSDGMTMMFYPGCMGLINTSIVDYNFQWIMTIDEFYLYSGDEELVRELYPKVILSMDWWEKRINTDGLLENVPSHIYLDNSVPELDKKGIVTMLNCFYFGTLRAAAKMAHLHGDLRNMRKWSEIADRLAKAINDKLFDTQAGVYADSYHDGALSERRSQHANLLPLLYNIVPSGRASSVWEHVINEDHLCRTKRDQEAGKTVAAAQPFFSYFLFEMIAKRGHFDRILELSRRLWKQMIDAGHGTLWEQWQDAREYVDDPGTQLSMCHAWAGTPTYHMSSDILGVRPTSPGFATFDIRPHTVDLTYAKGVYPSVKGDIEVSWKSSEKSFDIEFTVPEESIARVVLPVCNPTKVLFNGRETSTYSVGNGEIEFDNLEPGEYAIKIKR